MNLQELSAAPLALLRKIAHEHQIPTSGLRTRAALFEQISAHMAQNPALAQRLTRESDAGEPRRAKPAPHGDPAPAPRPQREPGAPRPLRDPTHPSPPRREPHTPPPHHPRKKSAGFDPWNGVPLPEAPPAQPTGPRGPRATAAFAGKSGGRAREFQMEIEGTLDILPDSYGFLRKNACPDTLLPAALIRRYGLAQGDVVAGRARVDARGRQCLLEVTRVNGRPAAPAASLPAPTAALPAPAAPADDVLADFERLPPVHPHTRLRVSCAETTEPALRLVDLVAPIGLGQRGLIVSPPKAGKTLLLQALARGIHACRPEAELIILLIDERPEEVTDMRRHVPGEVVASTFDQPPAHHVAVAEDVLRRARHALHQGRDIVLLMDSITRLARAYNLASPQTGRSLTGGLDAGALSRPKRFFGAARQLEDGGSLTILGTCLVDTGSRMDDIIYEEFKGTGNMEIHLSRKLAERRIFPAIDVQRSGTRREELLLTPDERALMMRLRRLWAPLACEAATENALDLLSKTPDTAALIDRVQALSSLWERQGYVLR